MDNEYPQINLFICHEWACFLIHNFNHNYINRNVKNTPVCTNDDLSKELQLVRFNTFEFKMTHFGLTDLTPYERSKNNLTTF